MPAFLRDIGAGTACLALLAGAHVAAAPLFPNPIAYSGQRSQAIASGEFNGDAIPDLVVLNLLSADVSVFLGRGDGTFAEFDRFLTVGGPTTLAVGDFNRDGRSDVAVATEYPGDVWIHEGNGNGSFTRRGSFGFGVGNYPSSMVAADLDGSGVLSLVVGSLYARDLFVLPGNGDGTFLPGIRYPMPASVRSVAVGDFNGDDDLDIAAAGYEDFGSNSFVSVLLGSRSGVFAPQPALLTGAWFRSVAVTDLNGDGHGDLVVAGTAVATLSGRLWRILGRGDGTFEPAEDVPLGVFSASAVAAADLDHDADTDLAVIGLGQVVVTLGQGGGTFSPPSSFELAGDAPVSMLMEDIDRDGNRDLVIANDYLGGAPLPPSILSVLLGRGDGSFVSNRTLPGGFTQAGVLAGDFNGDANPDLIGPGAANSSLALWTGSGDGTFQVSGPFQAGDSPWSLSAADFNGDDRLDVVVSNLQSGDISLLLNDGQGGFAPQRRFAAGGTPVSIAAGDFDGDHRSDVAVAIFGGGGANGNITLLPGTGTGQFGPPRRFNVVGSPVCLAAADLNHDGRLDLVVADQGNGTLGGAFVLLNQVSGGFSVSPALAGTANGGTAWVTIALLDPDGHPDVAVIDRPGARMRTYFGNGNGTFAMGSNYDAAPSPAAVTAGDFDADGRTDLVVAHDFRLGSSLFLQTSFRLHQFVGRFGIQGRSVAIDLDGDHRIDLASSSTGVTLAPNQGGYADGDGDGIPDDQDTCTDTDGDGFGNPGYARNLCSLDNCPGQSNVTQSDQDFDGKGDVCDPCPRDRHDDTDRDGACADVDNCPVKANLDQADADGDGVGTACDNCPADGNSDQVDRDRDGRGDACDSCALDPLDDGDGDGACADSDNCSVTSNADQADTDGDGHGDVCDNCANVANPAQEDANQDGSGDACQPRLVLGEVRRNAAGDLEVTADATDPQGDPLSGAIILLGMGQVHIQIEDEGIDHLGCDIGYRPDGVAGEAIAYLNESVGEPVLFDVDGIIGCVDGWTDFYFARGPCAAPVSPFDLVLSLSGMTTPFVVCVRRATGPLLDLTVTELDAGTLTGELLGGDAVLQETTYSGWPPPRVPLPVLTPGGIYRLAVTLTDGNTLPVSGEVSFEYAGQPAVVFVPGNHSPVAAIDASSPVECASSDGGNVRLDGSSSTDADSTAGTQDDIVGFEWFEAFGGLDERLLGHGLSLEVVLPVGEHRLTLRVTDRAGASAVQSVNVSVVDTLPPVLTVAAAPAALWPPNHELTSVQVAWEVRDACDASPAVTLIAVSSSEPDDAPGAVDGSTSGDIQDAQPLTPDNQVLLRAERSGSGSGRTYELTYQAVDRNGNGVTAFGLVIVPHDQGSGPEPLILRVEPLSSSSRLRIYWAAVPGAEGYDVIRVERAQAHVAGSVLDLGSVAVLARGSRETSIVESSPDMPPPGGAWLYLIQQRMPEGPTGYGTESAPWPRKPGACDSGCP